MAGIRHTPDGGYDDFQWDERTQRWVERGPSPQALSPSDYEDNRPNDPDDAPPLEDHNAH